MGLGLDPLEFEDSKKSLLKKERFIKKYYNYLLLAISFFALLAVYFFLTNSPEFFAVFIILSIILTVSLFGFIYSLKKRLVKLKVANQNGWLYSPDKSSLFYRDFSSRFPKIFDLGNKSRSLENIFWGSFKKKSKKYDFVAGDFNYVLESGSGKNRSSTYYTDHFFILNLKTDIKNSFYLTPKTFGSKIANLFSKKQIVTESIDFNNAFTFSYQKNNSETKIDILSVLSPKMLEDLVSFNQKKAKAARSLGGARVLFEKNCVLFTSPGPLLKVKGGITPSSLEVKKEDKKALNDELDFFFELGMKMSDSLTKSKY